MRKAFTFGLFIGLFLICGSDCLRAAAAVNPLTVTLPAGNLILPEPPAKGTPIWLRDSACYMEARVLRRAVRSVTQEDYDLLNLLGISKTIGTSTVVDSAIAKGREPYISWLKTYGYAMNDKPKYGDKTQFPKLYSIDSLCEKMKSYNTHESLYRVRQRPYYYFHDYYKNGKLDEQPTNYDSYPSGHGYFTGLFGQCMSYIDPKFSEVVINNNNTFGYQRLILGAHWASDVWAGRTLGNVAFSLALHDSTFVQKLRAAKNEMMAKAGDAHQVEFTDSLSHKNLLPQGKNVTDAPLATNTEAWKADSMLYMQALALRDGERGKLAEKDADYTTWLARFAAPEVMNIDITNAQLFPQLQKMVAIMREMAVYSADASRNHSRVAPNTYFAKGATTTSAISADAYMAWSLAMALVYIDPAHGPKIARTALDIAEGGYILGNYWQSEIENSEKMGSIGFAMAMRNPHFRALADAAIVELQKAKAIPALPDSVVTGQSLPEAQQAVNQIIGNCKTICDTYPDTTLNLYINRTFYCDGYYNTLCLPFAISAADWADADKNPLAVGTLKKFVQASIEDNVLNIEIEDASSIEAGVPYLIKFAEGEDIEKPLFCGIRVSKAQADSCQSTGMNNIGIFAPHQLPANQDYLFLGAENTFHWATAGDDYMRGFRTYFHVNNNTTGAPMRGMNNVQLAEKKIGTGDSSISEFTNLQIYKLIDNGCVTIIREGVRYSVDGQIR